MSGEGSVVVVPTYNERENLPRLVPEVLAQDPRLDILVVDDDSPDGTWELAQEMAESEPRVHVLRRAGPRGLGPAYIEGFRWSLERGYGRIVEMDADLSHPPRHLPELLEGAEEADVVIGSRYLNGRVSVVNWPIRRVLLSYFGTVYARVVTGLPVSDATGGFNCWRREVLEALDLDRIESNGYAFQIELKLRAWRKGFRIAEIPIVFTERDTGESMMSQKIVWEAVWKLWKFRFLELVGRL
ncbi:MAG TPA: polyprenol monophosphomannose synthase [Longimicrobiales bacterium]|nr:polyprenol monophosphomannose synthase [Longimicrobiales bacterium]